MRWIELKRKKHLNRCVNIPGAKNSSLALMAACCLSDEPIILKNVPHISDVALIEDISRDIGFNIISKEDYLLLDPTNILGAEIDPKKASAYRASYYFIGALLSKFKKVTLGYPGGDNFGSRPIDQHIKGLKALGADFKFYNDYYVVEAQELKGAEIFFDIISSGATINLMLAAARAKGKTILQNAARDPEIVDLAILLNKMGANIKGAGTSTIVIEGVNELKKCNHSVIPDRLIAGTFLMTAGITGGNITVKNVIPEHLLSCVAKLEETGLHIETGENYIRAIKEGNLRGVNVKASMYPGFATDLQQPLTAMLVEANGHSMIKDIVYPNRINHCFELNKMGADIIIQEEGFVIPGNRKLRGAHVHASDVRAGISLILAGLAAEGTTYITGIEHIERGYESIIETFSSIGADIKICEDNNMKESEFVVC